MKSKSSAKSSPKTAQVSLLTPAQLHDRQDRVLVIDFRGWFEYWMGHVPGAKRMNPNSILKDIAKDKAIVLTCFSGHRSTLAAQHLARQGYHKLYNLKGGLLAWQGAGYSVHRGNRP